MKAIEIVNLKKYYGKIKGVENVSFSVNEGEIFGFIGPNGSGKSTTIRSMLSLIFPTSGTIKIFGKDFIKDREEIAKNIGYLPSELSYYENMKVKDLLEYSASFYKVDCEKKRNELVDILNLDINRNIDDLSLGNKKKVGIVIAMQHSPKLIILDEPTSGLDPLIQQKFFEIIESENKKGTTILFSSHILAEVQRLSDRIGIIKNGEMVKIGKLEELKLTNYKNIYISAEKDILDKISKIKSIEELNRKNFGANYVYTGDINEFINSIASLNINDITISEPSIDDLFMQYFREN